MPKDGPNNQTPPPAPTVQPLAIGDVRAPSATASSPGQNELLQDVKRDESRATAFGTDPDAFFQSLGRVTTVAVHSGTGKDKTQTGTKQVFNISKKNRARFEKAQADFESRGGNRSTAETISRGAGGGSFQSVGDFSGGGIKIGGVKPLGG